jgi:hypothetical protein
MIVSSSGVLIIYRVVGAAGEVGAGAAGGAGGIGRVDEPTVVPGALATLGPLHGAHINKMPIQQEWR